MNKDKNDPTQTVNWAGLSGVLASYIAEESGKTLEAYRAQSTLVDEHANHEEDTARGGYAHRQLFELVQNSADALSDKPDGGRIAIRLTETFLYCADDGDPIDQDGVKALMFSHMSPKRETTKIGRFGLGFKSVLGVTDAPEFFSRSGSFHFDRERTRERIKQVVPIAVRYPVLRLPDSIDPYENRNKDDILREFMGWATNIVRLPLKPDTQNSLSEQMRNFPPEFLLFVEHVREMTLNDDLSSLDRTLELQSVDGEYLLYDGDKDSEWKLFKRTHQLSSDAQADRRSLDDNDEVLIWWAVPLDRLTDPGQFWAFFPTKTASLVAGILNAPWKTNEDRQNLLAGPYNTELIESAAKMIADELPNLVTYADPARHLDALPRRHEAGDSEQVELLRAKLFSNLNGREIIPDQDGKLCAAREVSYPPKELTSDSHMGMIVFERWAAYPGRPSDWLHRRAFSRTRLATIDRLYPPRWPDQPSTAAPWSTIAEWLNSLIGEEPEDAIEASKAAIQTAALLTPETRSNCSLGEIILTESGEWRAPESDNLFLPDELGDGGQSLSPESRIHPELATDSETLTALKKLGIKPPSSESSFRLIVNEVLRSSKELKATFLTRFWEQARKIDLNKAKEIIRERDARKEIRVLTRSGKWCPLYSVLLPGEIVPDDGSRDDDVTVDTDFHELDSELLRSLGVRDIPGDSDNLSLETWFSHYLQKYRSNYLDQEDLRRNPQRQYLNFTSTAGVGPLEVLATLSEVGRSRYSNALLSLDATYEHWKMRHKTQNIYPTLACESPAIYMLREHGRIQTSQGIFPLADAIGQQPKNPVVLLALLKLSKADKIKEAFNLAELMPEFIGEEEPIPLVDVWPALEVHLPVHRKTCELIRCERIVVGGDDRKWIFHAPNIYLARSGEDDEGLELRLICEGLELNLTDNQFQRILQFETQQEIEVNRASVRKCSTDAERLLAAVGEQQLRSKLPDSLLVILESENGTLTGEEIANAAIATYHSDALKEYKWDLSYLDPPVRWAGSDRAVEFVLSLGFSAEWAGERISKRPPFLEVEGPYSLPELHNYQVNIVDKVRDMFRNGSTNSAERRGMISMPTGSGKTRVAVQAIAQAMCHDDFQGGILWVADRDELCEQAVESWRQVWSNIGAHDLSLRISRLWAGQPRPMPTSSLHVVVATIQTLNAKLSHEPDEYEFLSNFKLVVFDEAHRSIAPTFTSVMQEIGLTRWKKENEPFLLGLTATPYRGRDEEETERLVNRYGNNRLDIGAFESDHPENVIAELQSMRVLARADHETIEGGVFSLSPYEEEQAKSTPWLPQSVEKRIADDAARTKRIIEAYETHVNPNWPTLIFATSVEHSKTVAALLHQRGIKSRAVSGETETSTRRRVVEEFRKGEIKALVNYGVFREGFDAPRTRAIIVARPVYSPNLYFQMIGRGLRGVKNGGNDRCLILNVQDNIQNFGRNLAFSELDWLWD